MSAHLAEVYGAEVSKQTITTITDRVVESMTEWHSRPRHKVYAVMFRAWKGCRDHRRWPCGSPVAGIGRRFLKRCEKVNGGPGIVHARLPGADPVEMACLVAAA